MGPEIEIELGSRHGGLNTAPRILQFLLELDGHRLIGVWRESADDVLH
jgi:hypothetical protein